MTEPVGEFKFRFRMGLEALAHLEMEQEMELPGLWATLLGGLALHWRLSVQPRKLTAAGAVVFRLGLRLEPGQLPLRRLHVIRKKFWARCNGRTIRRSPIYRSTSALDGAGSPNTVYWAIPYTPPGAGTLSGFVRLLVPRDDPGRMVTKMLPPLPPLAPVSPLAQAFCRLLRRDDAGLALHPGCLEIRCAKGISLYPPLVDQALLAATSDYLATYFRHKSSPDGLRTLDYLDLTQFLVEVVEKFLEGLVHGAFLDLSLSVEEMAELAELVEVGLPVAETKQRLLGQLEREFLGQLGGGSAAVAASALRLSTRLPGLPVLRNAALAALATAPDLRLLLVAEALPHSAASDLTLLLQQMNRVSSRSHSF